MSNREPIKATISLSAPQRTDPTTRAADLIGGGVPAEASPPPHSTSKLTTRVPDDHLRWLQEQARTYHRRHPRAPKLTIEELVRLAIDQLRESPHLDVLIGRSRGG